MAAGPNARRGSSSDEGLDIDGFRGLDIANNGTIASATSASIRPELLALRGVGGEHSNADVKKKRAKVGRPEPSGTTKYLRELIVREGERRQGRD